MPAVLLRAAHAVAGSIPGGKEPPILADRDRPRVIDGLGLDGADRPRWVVPLVDGRVHDVVAPSRGIAAATPVHGVVPAVLLDGDGPCTQGGRRVGRTPLARDDDLDVLVEWDGFGPIHPCPENPDRGRRACR